MNCLAMGCKAERPAGYAYCREHEAAYRPLRPDLTEEQKAEALRIGRIEFKSAGATRKR